MKAFKYISVILALLMTLTAGGVYATWSYAELETDEKNGNLSVSIGDFGETMHEGADIGEDHDALIDSIVDGENIGLNTLSSYINEQLAKRAEWGRDTLGSVAVLQGDSLADMFGTEAANLEFLIQTVSDTKYYLFTTNIDLGTRGTVYYSGGHPYNSTPGSPNVPIGEPIYAVYRTVIKLIDGVWTRIITEEGYATSAWYDENQLDAYKNATQIPCFNPNTWMPGRLGGSTDEAIWTYSGQTIVAKCDREEYPSIYYQITYTSRAYRTVTAESADCTIEIIDSTTGNTVATSTVSGSTASVRWRSTANRKYYIKITSDDAVTFTVN